MKEHIRGTKYPLRDIIYPDEDNRSGDHGPGNTRQLDEKGRPRDTPGFRSLQNDYPAPGGSIPAEYLDNRGDYQF